MSVHHQIHDLKTQKARYRFSVFWQYLEVNPVTEDQRIGHCRGQGDALNVDRHDLYQALYSTLATAPLGDLEPLRRRLGDLASEPDQAAVCGGETRNGPRGGAAAAGPGSQNRQGAWPHLHYHLPFMSVLQSLGSDS